MDSVTASPERSRTFSFRSPRHQQALLALSLIALIVTGIYLGWQSAVVLQQKQLDADLQRSLTRIQVRLNEIIDETSNLFESLDALSLTHCSDELLLEMRTHLFEARFIKDIGGIRGDSLYCSTALGRLDKPLVSGPPDVLIAKGIGLRTDRTVLASARLRTMVIEGNGFNALVDPRHVTDLTASLGDDEIYLSSQIDPDRVWFPFQASGQTRLDQLARSRSAGVTSTGCDNYTGLCVKLNHLPVSIEAGQRETRIVMSSLGGALGLGFFLGGLSLVRHRNTAEHALRRAIVRGHIKAVYQPIISLPEQQTFGFEALARWEIDNQLAVPPDEFIDLAERSGLIDQISQLMIRQVGEELGAWLSESADRRIALNIAPSELADDRLELNLEAHLLARGILPEQILLEITERTMLESESAAIQIESLARRGFRVYADDFGVGYCGLGYLNDLEMDGIKISQSFTAAVATDSPKAVLVPRIIEMARELGLAVIVEGVETRQQCQVLADLGPVMAQGWYFARELPAAEIIKRFS